MHKKSVADYLEADLKMQRVTKARCVEKGCGSHYISSMSECGTCGEYVCARHDCGCPLPGEKAAYRSGQVPTPFLTPPTFLREGFKGSYRQVDGS